MAIAVRVLGVHAVPTLAELLANLHGAIRATANNVLAHGGAIVVNKTHIRSPRKVPSALHA